MAIKDLFKLVGSIYVDNGAANDSLAKTDKKAANVGETFGKVAKGAAKVGTAIVAGAGAAAAGVMSLADKTAQNADVVDKASQRMGVSAEYYQKLSYAAGQSGVDIGVFEKAAKKLAGTGVSVEDALAQIYDITDAEERAAKATELFGTSAVDMLPMLNAGKEGFDELTQRAEDLGLVMSDDAIAAGVKLGDTMSDIKQSSAALATNLGASLLPVVQSVADKILEFMPTIQGMITRFAPILEKIFDSIVPPLLQMADTILPVLFDLLEQILPVISEVLDAMMPILTDVITPLIKLLAVGLTAALRGIIPVVKWVASNFKTIINTVIGFLNGAIDGLNIILTPLRAIIAAVGNIFGAKWDMDSVAIPHIPELAKGGTVSQTGSAIVGEAGAELIEMPQGARVTPLNGNGLESLEVRLDRLYDLVEGLTRGMGVYINGGALVGQIAPDMDRALGRLAFSAGRGI